MQIWKKKKIEIISTDFENTIYFHRFNTLGFIATRFTNHAQIYIHELQ